VAALRRIEDAVAARRRAERLAAALQREVEERRSAEEELRRFKLDLEARVASRTVELEAANRELEAFVYSVSHDLRAPLRAIDGFSYIVAEDAGGRLTDADREHLQRVRAAAQRMGTLIDELLAFSRASRQQPLIEDVDMVALVGSVVDELRRGDPDRRVDVVVSPHLRARADPTLLRMILENLIGNAWKFSSHHDEARIAVGVVEVDGERAYFVRDDGAGFDAGAAHHLFGAFQRYHAPDEFDGDGIGLAIVHRLVGRHGGRVWADSAVEQGATFSFTLGPSSASS
jgi:light-regulated signal transduction histidine kinase (bacteriophytochrome)